MPPCYYLVFISQLDPLFDKKGVKTFFSCVSYVFVWGKVKTF